MGSSWTTGQAHVPCIGRWILKPPDHQGSPPSINFNVIVNNSSVFGIHTLDKLFLHFFRSTYLQADLFFMWTWTFSLHLNICKGEQEVENVYGTFKLKHIGDWSVLNSCGKMGYSRRPFWKRKERGSTDRWEKAQSMSFRLNTEKGGFNRNVEDGGRAGKETKMELIYPVCV